MAILYDARQRKWQFILLSVLILIISSAIAQECSETKLCATGCCSEFGFCGTDTAHCGKGCKSTCDYKLGCDKSNPCAPGTGCCNKFGFCGLGPDYCAGAVCVAGCDSKSYCDPGYGAPGFAEVEKCPLNVCCSKFGFCGLTEEFCGTKTVARPSCSTNGPISRVVGYYEGWASRRGCDSFPPRQIPLGVYTHINYAFASIDPVTFQIRIGEPADIKLYKEVTLLKVQQPDLKVFIAIGGWTFNDPGPTQTTFSNLARSTDNQKKFFISLSSFLSTYDFDGVDIDWEYPEAPDRGGRGEDFANFPTFITNLKSHLSSTGGRNGLSVTLPASYWYLQHFDIVKLQSSVDFFNIMTYDFHGIWDKENDWIGNYLNAHTNLTEITSALDLLWRNNIEPDKVTLGLGFYARTFTMTTPSCSAPGCTFESAGNVGLCTNSVGTLSNAEIADRIEKNGLTPIHYVDAAVKVITWDDQWVAYDDADTYKQKVDFARSLCLGGVMVWALSQDSKDLASSRAIASITQRNIYGGMFFETTPGTGAQPNTTVTTSMKHRQCRWSNCGRGCDSVGDNFVTVMRSSGNHYDSTSKSESIQDSTYCGGGGILRQFCCPADSVIPKCGHFYFNNGKCSGDTNDDTCTSVNSIEVGGYSGDCNNQGSGGYEQICCSRYQNDEAIKSLALYDQCLWNGKPGNCDTKLFGPVNSGVCPSGYSVNIAASSAGSGATECGYAGLDTNGLHLQHRDYCCEQDKPNERWTNCVVSASGGFPSKPPPGRSDKWCDSTCPVGKVRVAMDNEYLCNKSGGARAWCCDDNYIYNIKTTTTVNPELLGYQNALKDFMANELTECFSPDFGYIGRRSLVDTVNYPTSSLSIRAQDVLGKTTSLSLVSHLLYILLSSVEDGDAMLKAMKVAWDENVTAKFKNLAIHILKLFRNSDPRYSSLSDLEMSGLVPCNMEGMNKIIGAANNSNSPAIQCSQFAWTEGWNPDFFKGDQDYIDSQGSASTRKRSVLTLDDVIDPEEIAHFLAKRTGDARSYNVNIGTDSNGNPIIIIILSWQYPNGQNGQAFVESSGNNVRYTLEDPGDCSSAAYMGTVDPDAAPAWVVEHIFELQTVARVLEFVISTVLPSVTTAGVTVPEFRSQYTPQYTGISSSVFKNWFQTAYENWGPTAVLGGLTGRPDQRLMYQLGAKGNTDHLVLMDAVGNSLKGNCWNLRSPISDDRWTANGYNMPVPANGEAALSAIRGVLGVINYLGMPAIDGNLHAVVQALHASMLEFQTTFNLNRHLHGQFINIMPIWDEGVSAWGLRVNFFIRQWILTRISQLRTVWTGVRNDPVLGPTAAFIIAQLEILRVETEAEVFNEKSWRP